MPALKILAAKIPAVKIPAKKRKSRKLGSLDIWRIEKLALTGAEWPAIAEELNLRKVPSPAELIIIQARIEKAHKKTKMNLMKVRLAQALLGKVSPMNDLLKQLIKPAETTSTKFRIVRKIIQPPPQIEDSSPDDNLSQLTDIANIASHPLPSQPVPPAILAEPYPANQLIPKEEQRFFRNMPPEEAYQVWLANQLATKEATNQVVTEKLPNPPSKVISTLSIMAREPSIF